MTKISKQEFENYAELVKKFFTSIPEAKTNKEKEFVAKMGGIYWNSLRKQNTFVLMFAIENVELFYKDEDDFANRKLPELGNLTTQQFLENLREKLKKHYQAKGNLQSSNSPIEEKYEKTRYYMRKKNKQKFKEITPYLSEEFYQEISELFSLQNKIEKLFEEYNVEYDNDNSDRDKELMIKKYPFVVENLAANFSGAERKKTEQENIPPRRENSTDNSTTNQKPPSQPNQNNNPSSENSSNSEDKSKIDQLEREKAQLENQIKELQNKLSNTNLSPEKIKDYESQLSQSLKDIRNKTQQIQQTKSETTPEKGQEISQNSAASSSFDWKWAVGIGLGVFIILLLLILIVVNVSRQKKE